MSCIVKQLQAWGIDVFVAENASGDSSVWDALAEGGNVLMVCLIGTATHRMIDEEMDFYLGNGIAVAGTVAFVPQGEY